MKCYSTAVGSSAHVSCNAKGSRGTRVCVCSDGLFFGMFSLQEPVSSQ